MTCVTLAAFQENWAINSKESAICIWIPPSDSRAVDSTTASKDLLPRSRNVPVTGPNPPDMKVQPPQLAGTRTASSWPEMRPVARWPCWRIRRSDCFWGRYRCRQGRARSPGKPRRQPWFSSTTAKRSRSFCISSAADCRDSSTDAKAWRAAFWCCLHFRRFRRSPCSSGPWGTTGSAAEAGHP